MGRKINRGAIVNGFIEKARTAGPRGRHFIGLAAEFKIAPSTAGMLCAMAAEVTEDLEYEGGHLRRAPKYIGPESEVNRGLK